MKFSGHRKQLSESSKLSNLMLLTSLDTKRPLMLYSCLPISPRENWFQYVHRVYATAINFPSISTLHQLIDKYRNIWHTIQKD